MAQRSKVQVRAGMGTAAAPSTTTNVQALQQIKRRTINVFFILNFFTIAGNGKAIGSSCLCCACGRQLSLSRVELNLR